MKIPQCDRCLFYTYSPHLVCAVHPSGVTENHCIDFRQNPNKQEDETLWCPDGYSYYDGELIPNRAPRLTREEQWEILNTHPLFTGVCPQCGHEFNKNNPPKIHWDCPSCNWVDDSV